MRLVKIVATLYEKFDIDLFRYIDIARFNFSHRSYGEIDEWLELIEEAERKFNKEITVLADTKGPEIRTGAGIELRAGERIDVKELKLSNETAFRDVLDSGDIVLIDDGKVMLRAIDKNTLEALSNYPIKPRKSVIVRNKDYNIASITKEDLEDLEFIKVRRFDVIAQSFVRTPEDVLKMKELSGLPVIAKIETASAVRNIDEIIKVADGIMIARGDLALSIPEEKLPKVQSMILKKANKIPVIVATQVLSSMTDSPFPKRAELTDIYNAVINGADALMLSEETAVGKYKRETLEIMHRTILEAQELAERVSSMDDYKDKIAYSATMLAEEFDSPIIAPTYLGTTPRKISSFRPKQPIYAITSNHKITGYLNLFYGVFPRVYNYEPIFEKFNDIKRFLGLDRAVFVFGYPPGNSNTNSIVYI
ncbi:MAG: pyruvate kinase [Candidatus Anstonellales archaeon]